MKLLADHRGDNPYRARLVRELVAFNDRHAPREDWRFIGFYALDDAERLVGGVQGQFEWDWLHITHLWVRQQRQGLGRQLIVAAEEEARRYSKRGVFLDTLDFQARPFYEKLGFAVIGTIENAAGPNARYFMAKRLS